MTAALLAVVLAFIAVMYGITLYDRAGKRQEILDAKIAADNKVEAAHVTKVVELEKRVNQHEGQLYRLETAARTEESKTAFGKGFR